MKKVNMLAEVKYLQIDDQGLHIELDGQKRILPVDNVVICAGQVSETGLAEPLRAAGLNVHIIGGAKLAAELDAKRAIKEGAELAASL
jgi:2,4-dienoyl-CoA reductase (NADPH2)